MLLFFGLGSAVWIGLHYYLGRRLIGLLRAAGPRWRRLAWGVVAVLGAASPAIMVVGRILEPSALLGSLRWVAYSLMGLSAVLLMFLIARDLGWLAWRGLERLWIAGRSTAPARVLDPGRRQFIFDTTSVAVLASTAGCTGAGFVVAHQAPTVNPVDVPIDGLHPDLDGLRIAQLSDVHVGPTISGADLAEMVATVNDEKPDLIVITGDLVDGFVEDMRDEVAPIGQLQAPLGVFFCTGNHEYYWDGPAWCAEVERLGVSVLTNAHRVVQRGAARLCVAGVPDFRAGGAVEGHRFDPHAALEGADAVDFKVMLAHQPRGVERVAAAGAHLQLSGHTHGGQFFPFNLLVGFAHPFVAGLHRTDDMWIFVSTGAGYWGPHNRLGVPSEIPILTLRRA